MWYDNDAAATVRSERANGNQTTRGSEVGDTYDAATDRVRTWKRPCAPRAAPDSAGIFGFVACCLLSMDGPPNTEHAFLEGQRIPSHSL